METLPSITSPTFPHSTPQRSAALANPAPSETYLQENPAPSPLTGGWGSGTAQLGAWLVARSQPGVWGPLAVLLHPGRAAQRGTVSWGCGEGLEPQVLPGAHGTAESPAPRVCVANLCCWCWDAPRSTAWGARCCAGGPAAGQRFCSSLHTSAPCLSPAEPPPPAAHTTGVGASPALPPHQL